MPTTRDRRLLRAVAALSLLSASLAAPAQQASPRVPSNIDESNNMVLKHPQGGTMPQSLTLTPVPEGFERLKLAPGYLLQMDIFAVPEMSTELRIDGDGNVTVPLAGALHVEGDTLPEAQSAIARALVDREILKDPQVTLNVVQFTARFISVLGEVQTPGHIQMLGPEPLGNVLSLAGGETIAAGSDIEIQRRAPAGLDTRHVHWVQGSDPAVLQNTTIEPGDTVVVHRAGVVYVLGAVNRPGGYLMVNGGTLSVVQAVSLAGGVTLQASTHFAVVVRRQPGGGYVQFRVPLGKMQRGGAAPVALEMNDALYVPPSTWKSIVINGSNVLSAAASAAIISTVNN